MASCWEIRLAATARSAADVEALRNMGLRLMEIPITDPGRFASSLTGFRRLREAYGLTYLCHGPREGDPNDWEHLEHEYYPRLLEVLALMPALGMALLTVHLWMDPRFVKTPVRKRKVGLLGRLVQRAKGMGIRIGLENLSEHAEHLRPVLNGVPGLGLTLDLGHGELLCEKNAAADIIRAFPERILHVHLHDNRGGQTPEDDLHLPPGEGVVDFPLLLRLLREAGYAGTMTLELRPEQVRDALPRVRALLRATGKDGEKETPHGA